MSSFKQRMYPEVRAGGFGRADSTVEFFTRVNALVNSEMTVVDFGAGRGQFMDLPPSYRRDLQSLRGKVKSVLGLDVDPAVATNKSLDSSHVLGADGRWPLADASVDLVFSDWTFEHVDNPAVVGAEATRVLKPGGWLCARTPNKWGYISLGARMVPNRLHTSALQHLQPQRESRDVFPTRYLLNSPGDVARAFPLFDLVHYNINGEPAYFGSSRAAWRTAQLAHRLLPNAAGAISLFFLQRRADDDRPNT